jgi:hypothetical protein
MGENRYHAKSRLSLGDIAEVTAGDREKKIYSKTRANMMPPDYEYILRNTCFHLLQG